MSFYSDSCGPSVVWPKRIPELARGLGKGIREFRKAAEDIKNEIEGAAGNDDNPGKS